MTPEVFRCWTLMPLGFGSPDLALATLRAGGVALLDAEFCRDADAAHAQVERILARGAGEAGLRLCGDHPEEWGPLLERFEQFEGRPHWVVLRAREGRSLKERVASLPPSEQRMLVVELTDVDQLAEIDGIEVSGLIARGHEAGGWVGDDASFLLVRKILRASDLPVYVQGGIGVHNAAGCRAAGAAGVILDDQLLLMPESPLPKRWQRHIEQLTGQEARVLGGQLGDECRSLQRPGLAGAKTLAVLASECVASSDGRARWRTDAARCLGWGSPDEVAWPVGQAVGLAASMRRQYRTTGRLVQAVVRVSEEHLRAARSLRPLGAAAPLAESHATRFPLVQGPMTRVSDNPEFADAVARAGGLPFVALALMTGEQSRDVLRKTAALLEDRPWGVGLLGFVPQKLREKQIEAIFETKPPFALIAGGRPDQAAQFEAQGIATYIHAPSPELLRLFLEQGAKRFVFEGRECGGHVGPLSSFVLWEAMIDVLLEQVPERDASDIHLLFAGGVCDGMSAGMLSAIAAPLAERGMKVGALMGTAYLFSDEIVSSGAIMAQFREQAIACQKTTTLETGPGHASRCAVTPFADAFHAESKRLHEADASADEIRDQLEDMSLGRLRVATKGVDRGEDGTLHDVSAATQLSDGMYMIGQVATLLDRKLPLEKLHDEVCEGSVATIERACEPLESLRPRELEQAPSDIAIIGVGLLLPGATDRELYWRNIIDRVGAIQEIPKERFDWRLYFDANPKEPDKIYSKWGGFLDEVAFDSTRFGIPPNSLRSIDPIQLLTLETVRRALEDCGYENGDYDREHTSVILGASGGLGDLGLQYGIRSELPRFVDNISEETWQRLPEWTEESFAGTLLNVSAGRVANRFDTGGLNFTVDAACASSLAAVNIAVNELETGRSNLALVGGIDTVQSPFGYLCFSKTQALSPNGRPRTFDEASDGIVISEGLAVIVLKRLQDAERDGDRIYATIKAVAGSSDGKALGLTAPLPEGQMRAVNRAYAKAGFSPSTLSLIEAHGTGTAVGDRAEAETVVRTLRAANMPPKSCAIGSVKTLLGHTKAAAGVVGLAKVALSLHHKVIPPHEGVERPIAPILEEDSPLYLLEEPQPWLAVPDHPRRAASSAFGFGGTNFHAVLEEYDGSSTTELGAADWPCELFLLTGSDSEGLAASVDKLREALEAGAQPRLRDLAYSMALKAESRSQDEARAAVVAGDLAELQASLATLATHLRTGADRMPPDLRIGRIGSTRGERGKLAFVFPGQGAQDTDMLREATLYLPELRAAFEAADALLAGRYAKPLSHYIFVPRVFEAEHEKRLRAELTDTHVAQPAIGAAESGLLDFARRLGLRAEMTAGHSYGEFTALHAAGVLSREDFLRLSETRGRVMREACTSAQGTMAAVAAERSVIEEHLAGVDVVIANHNAPLQTVISGANDAIDEAVATLRAADLEVRPLPVAGAFHTELMAPARGALEKAIYESEVTTPKLDVYANATARPYPVEVDEIRAQLSQHLLQSVEFVEQIDAMYRAGARVFIELGPRSILSNLIGQILSGKEHRAVSLDGSGGGMRGLLRGLSDVWCEAAEFSPVRLFDGRQVEEVDLNRLASLIPAAPSATTWWVSGGCSRPPTDSVRRTGTLPTLDLESSERAQRQQQRVQQAQLAPAPQAPAPAPQPAAPVTAPLLPQQSVVPQPAPSPMPALGQGPVSSDALQAYHETMRQFLRLQEQVMTSFLGAAPATGLVQPILAATPAVEALVSAPTVAPNMLPAPAVATPAVEFTPPTPPTPPVRLEAAVEPAAIGHEALAQFLLEIVSERTGYPEEMLDRTQDLEAELGIDSIKRVEILGALQRRLPDSVGEALQANMETLTRAKTLDGIVEAVAAMMDADSPLASAAPSTAPSEPAVDAQLDLASLQQTLVEIVSERTGYPSDMLAPDQDLEAELGIDSIKRVEILGALQRQLPDSIAAQLQEGMEALTRAKTLVAIVAEIASIAGAMESDGPAAVSARPGAAQDAPQLDPEVLLQELVDIVSERTGYPAEMLDPDQDLEAELGIDSIKRVEILGVMQRVLPDAHQVAFQENMEVFTREKTLRGIVQRLGELAESDAPALEAARELDSDAAPLESELPPPSAPAPRYLMRAFDEARPPRPPIENDGVFVVTDDGGGVSECVCRRLADLGLDSVLLDVDTLADSTRLARAIEELQAQPLLRGVVHLAGMARFGEPAVLADWHAHTRLQVKALFQLLRGVAPVLRDAGAGRLLAVTADGGHFGRDGEPVLSVPGSRAAMGLFKSAAQEWTGVSCAFLDLAREQNAEALAREVIEELFTPGTDLEVGISAGQRWVYRASAASPVATSAESAQSAESLVSLVPDASWVVLVTGGARGITAEIAHELAVPGMHFEIVGRSELPEPEDSETSGLDDPQALRLKLIERARAGGDTPTPAAIGAELSALLRGREMRRNLDRFREAGVEVSYHATDVSDDTAFSKLLDQLYQRYGRIDCVMHGAGIIEDKLIEEKTMASFERVFDTKADSAWLLTRRLVPESLKLVVLFGSVAGRFGNRGQADYAAANEVVCGLAHELKQRAPATRVMCLNWGPWQGAGMANEQIQAQFEARGIVPVTPTAGRLFFREELAMGDPGEVEIVAGEGPWETLPVVEQLVDQLVEQAVEQVSEQTVEPSVGPISSGSAPAKAWVHPLAGDTLETVNVAGDVTIEHEFSLQSDPYLADHCLGSVPVLPATAAAEWMARVAQSTWPDRILTELRDVRVLNGFKLDDGPARRAIFRLRTSSHADVDAVTARIELLNPDNDRPYYRGYAVLHRDWPELPRELPSPLTSGESLDPAVAYRDFLFHGPMFRLVSSIDRVSPRGVDAIVRPSDPALWLPNGDGRPGCWLLDPGLLDTAPQLAIVWSRVLEGSTPLPSRFGRIVRCSNGAVPSSLRLALRVREHGPNSMTYDAAFIDENDCVRLFIEDAEAIGSAALNHLTGGA